MKGITKERETQKYLEEVTVLTKGYGYKDQWNCRRMETDGKTSKELLKKRGRHERNYRRNSLKEERSRTEKYEWNSEETN